MNRKNVNAAPSALLDFKRRQVEATELKLHSALDRFETGDLKTERLSYRSLATAAGVSKDTIGQKRDGEYLHADLVSRFRRVKASRITSRERRERAIVQKSQLTALESDNEKLRRVCRDLDIELYELRRENERLAEANVRIMEENRILGERLAATGITRIQPNPGLR